MKVQIEKSTLVSALEKMYNVSTKALIPNFNFTGRVTIEVKDSGRVVFTSSNGCLTAQQEVEPADTKTTEKGICTTDSIKLRAAVKNILTDSSSTPIELAVVKNVLRIRDSTAKRKKLVTLPQEKLHHNTSIVKKPDGNSLFMEADHFLKAFRTVSPFHSEGQYALRYQAVCLHWVSKEVRMVCGDGAMFAVFAFPRHPKDSNKREFKRAILISQLSVIGTLFDTANCLEFVWKDKTSFWLQGDNGIELFVHGLPDITYPNYEANAYRFDEAKAYVDIERKGLKEISDLLISLQDKEREEQGRPHSCYLSVPTTDGFVRFEIRKDQGKFQCEYEIPAEYYDLGDHPNFSECYAHIFFATPAAVMRNSHLRFYLLEDDNKIVNARDVELGEEDRDGVPQIKEDSDGCSLSFFFAGLADDEEIEEDDDA